MKIKLANKATDVLEKIDLALIEKTRQQKPRTYMGASMLGKECDRQVWYSYKFPVSKENPSHIRRMMTGHLFESEAIALLRNAGFEVFYQDENGNQYSFSDGKLGGNCDGFILINDVPHLLEIKSANDKRFNEMVKLGIKISDPVYYYQVQVYMKYFEVDRCFFYVINKNTSEHHGEYIDFSPMEADYAINRAKEIAEMDVEPERKYKSSAFFKCKFCDFRSKCWDEKDTNNNEIN